MPRSGQGIVLKRRLHDSRFPVLRITDRHVGKLYNDWGSRRSDRLLPARTDIDPVELRFLFDHVIVLDVLREPLQFRVRIQGEALRSWIGGDLTGKTLDQPLPASFPPPVRDCLTIAVEAGVAQHWAKEPSPFRSPCPSEALFLPLAEDGVTVDAVLAALCRPDEYVAS